MSRLSTWTVLALSGILVGCAGTPIIPTHVPFGQHDLTPINSKKPVAVINRQEVRQAELVSVDYANTMVDLNACCERSISLIGEWLDYNKIPVHKDADKRLYVSVSNPKADKRGSHTLDLKIQTGDGLVKVFKTECTAFPSGRAFGYAINWGVVKVMHDADILNYLEK
ncbi:MAG: hypothetical protein AB1512_08565 [Thermodesulfobacteriota bacterium]